MKFYGNGISIEYELFGPEGAPVVVLSHSLGSSSVMWAPQLPKLAEKYRGLCYDTRGHGGTAAATAVAVRSEPPRPSKA